MCEISLSSENLIKFSFSLSQQAKTWTCEKWKKMIEKWNGNKQKYPLMKIIKEIPG